MLPEKSQIVNFIKNPQNIVSVLGVIVILPILVALAIKGYFVRYVADDFCTAASVSELGWVKAQFDWYLSWSGRFSFTAIITALEAASMWVAQVLPMLTIVGWLAALYWVFNLLQNRIGLTINRATSVFIAMLVVAIYVVTSPHQGQIFYWFTGNITYTLPIVLLTVASGLVLKSFTYSIKFNGLRQYLQSRQFTFACSAAGMFFIATSLNETYAVFQLALLGLLLAFIVLNQAQSLKLNLAHLASVGLWVLATLGSFLVMYISPGNTARRLAYPDNPSIGSTIEYALNATNTFLIHHWQYALYMYLFIISVCFFALSMKSSQKFKQSIDVEKNVYLSIIIIVVAYAMCALVYIPSYYVQHYPTWDRSLSTIPFTLAIASIMLGYQVAKIGLSFQFIRRLATTPLLISIILAIVVYIFISQTIYAWSHFMRELPQLQQYAQEWDEQSMTLFDKGKNHAPHAYINRLGHTFELDDVSHDSSHWINQCVSNYYNIGAVEAKE